MTHRDPYELCLDTETTGLEYGDHRIVEFYADLQMSGMSLDIYHEYIDPKRSISAEAFAVHKISPAMLAGKPDWETLAPSILKMMTRADVYVAHNASFDLDFIRYELKRVGLIMPERHVVDTTDFTWATADGKKPNLKELCIACDVEFDAEAAHAASYDVNKMTEALYAARRFGPRFAAPAIQIEDSVAA